jgi:hypothetical protein
MENYEVQRGILNLPEYVFPATMVVFGYPTEQQECRKKPERSDLSYLVHENQYRRMKEEELKKMLSVKTASEDYESWIRAFCKRKYQSDFAKEMTRSVREFLKQFSQVKGNCIS